MHSLVETIQEEIEACEYHLPTAKFDLVVEKVISPLMKRIINLVAGRHMIHEEAKDLMSDL